jgi:hypothetical protein
MSAETIIKDEAYWHLKHPVADIVYAGRPLPGGSVNFPQDVRNFITNRDCVIRKQMQTANLIAPVLDDSILNIQAWVSNRFKYTPDTTLGCPEFFLYPCEALQRMAGDCVAAFESILTESGPKLASEIVKGDRLLSYDFFLGRYVYKPVVNAWDKGIQAIHRVLFRNGSVIHVTENHPLLVRTNGKESRYERRNLSDVKQTYSYQRKVPVCRKLPYTEIDVPTFSEDHCFLLGHFIAE